MSLARAFVTVGGMTLISRMLGLAREILIAALLGASAAAEAFFVAFRFPNLFRRFFAEGAFNMAFVPMFAKRVAEDGAALEGGAAQAFGEQVLAGLLSVVFVLVLIAQLAMPWLIFAIAFGFADDPEKLQLSVALSQIQFPYLLFMSLVAMFSGILNALNRFAAAAGAPIILNMLMIGAMVLGASSVENGWTGEDPAARESVAYWLASSVFAAGVAQLALVWGAARRAGMALRLRRPRWTPELKKLLWLGAPGAVAGGVAQLNILIGTTIATFFDGAVAWLTYADRVYQLPLGVVGVAIGVALLPELSRRVREDDRVGAQRALNRAIEYSMALTLPAAVALVLIPDEIVRLLFGRGAFQETDVAATATALALFAAGLPAYVLIKALSPAFFAREDTVRPLRYATLSMVVNTALSIGLAPFLSWVAIPIGTAAAAWVNAVLLWRRLSADGGYDVDPRLGRRLIAMAGASAAMGAVVLAASLGLGAGLTADPVWRYPAVLGLIVLGLVAYAGLSVLFGAVSPREMAGALRRGPAR